MNNIKLQRLSSGGSGFLKMTFLNGEIDVKDGPGVKVIASGCGSGKTTIIKKMIKRYNSEGILYAAATIDECNKMYDWIVKNVVGGEDEMGNELLLPDVVSIHSEPRYDENGNINNGVYPDLWNNHPEAFRNRKIIICTHYKLLHEYPNLLIGYGLNVVSLSTLNEFDRVDYMNPSGFIENPRKYVLIDELPRCGVLKKSYKPYDLSGVIWSQIGNFYYNRKSNKVELRMDNTRIEDYQLAKALYDKKSEVNNDLVISKSDSEPAKLRKDLIISYLHKHCNEISSIEDKDIIARLNILNLRNRYSRIMIFEGTGDLLFKENKDIEVYDIYKRYNSEVTLTRLDKSINRKVTITSDTDRQDLFKNINSMLDETVAKVFQRPDIYKVLIVTWKNLRSSDNENNKSFFNTEINENFSFTEYVKDYLIGRTNKEFSIIHYQSGLDRATNEFRDYDSIVFLGEFHIPNTAISELCLDLGCDTNPNNYLLHQLVQAVCRTQIRKHDGLPINVFYTNDWTPSIIRDLENYLLDKPMDRGSYIGDLNIRDKWKNQIQVLSNYDNNISLSIRQGLKYSFSIGLDEIYRMIPVKYKEVRYYYSLINYLRKLGIDMTVNTTNGSNQFSKKV